MERMEGLGRMERMGGPGRMERMGGPGAPGGAATWYGEAPGDPPDVSSCDPPDVDEALAIIHP